MQINKPDGLLLYDTHWEGYILGADTTHQYLWLWHGYNIRLIAVPHGDEGKWGYDHAWCYPRDPNVVEAAAAAWDPDTQDEPTGWHKRPTPTPRRAPNRDQQPEYNQPRCAHGSYITDGCRTVNCPDTPKPKTRGECPACHRQFNLTSKGLTGRHYGMTSTGFSTGKRCDGAGRKPFIPVGA